MREVTGQEGQVIAGRYRLVDLVGSGGMGCVWRARHVTLGTPLAVKVVRAQIAANPGMLERFTREAKAAARLRSKNVVQILDHGVDDGAPFIAMELLDGETLAARLRREGRLSPEATARVIDGIACALTRAHELGIVHRDLKPDNVFLARADDGESVKVLDFGIAKVMDPMALDSQERRSTETGTMLGTPCYMSPEQARGRKEMDSRSDLWSLAVIAFECLTGRRPFEAAALGELMMLICSDPIPKPSSIADVPRGFDAWFERATRREPAARFQTASELASELAAVLAPGSAKATPVALDQPRPETPPVDEPGPAASAEPPRAGGHRRVFALALAGALALATVAALVSSSKEPAAGSTSPSNPARAETTVRAEAAMRAEIPDPARSEPAASASGVPAPVDSASVAAAPSAPVEAAASPAKPPSSGPRLPLTRPASGSEPPALRGQNTVSAPSPPPSSQTPQPREEFY